MFGTLLVRLERQAKKGSNGSEVPSEWPMHMSRAGLDGA
jgi:hypothetical protein